MACRLVRTRRLDDRRPLRLRREPRNRHRRPGKAGAIDLTGLARPARFAVREVQAGAAYVLSEPVVVLAGAGVKPIVSVGGEYSINGRPFTAAAGMVWPGSRVRMRVLLPTGACEGSARLIIGGQSTEFRATATVPGRDGHRAGAPDCARQGQGE